MSTKMVLKNVEFKESELKREESNNKIIPTTMPSKLVSTSSSNAMVEDIPLVVPPHHHRLQYQYWLWYSKRTPGKLTSVQSYNDHLKLLQKFGSVEQFWEIYTHLIRPSEFQSNSDLHLFKVGVKPMWEDEANKNGGKWLIRLRKGLASRCWENLILAMLGEQFMVGDEICGAVISVRFQEDIISIWNRTSSDVHTTNRIRDTLRRVLNLPQNTFLEYKTHNDSLRHNSSFRNTDVFKT